MDEALAGRHAMRILDVVRNRHGARDTTACSSEEVLRSWIRCVNDYRLDPNRAISPPVLTGVEMQTRFAQSADVIECAKMELTTLYQQLADPDCAVVLAGIDGVILHMVSSPAFSGDVERMGFRPGAIWSEREAGTNGPGTCAAVGAPVAVRLTDHFYAQYASLTCSAVPIVDPLGEIAAVLDVTSRSRLLQQHSLVLLDMTARLIENRLMDLRFRDSCAIRFHSRPEFVYTLHEGKLALDERGTIRGANRSALMQLGVRSVGDLRGRTLQDIFEATLPDLLARSERSGFHPVATFRARVANRFFIVVHPPATAGGTVRPLGRKADLASAPLVTGNGVPVVTPPPADASASRAAAEVVVPEFGDLLVAEAFRRGLCVVRRGIPILMHGETGSGKEVVARALHAASPFSAGEFVAINCASLPETLIESELFGYRAGAFTGAQRTGRRGKILQASRGTLFLDEIGDMPLPLQARLLRVLDERRITPLGSEDSFPVEFQLVSASHRDLFTLVTRGEFREDLFFRINGLTIALPPLRARQDLAQLLRRTLDEESDGQCALSPQAEAKLLAYSWPGNLRQLRHVSRSLAALFAGRTIEVDDIPPELLRVVGSLGPGATAATAPAVVAVPAEVPVAAAATGSGDGDARLGPFEENARQLMLRTLEAHRWNVSHVAKVLGVSRNTVYRKLHKLRIDFTGSEPK